MDVAVSGSTGLIGSALRPALEAAGHRVVPLVRGEGDRDGVVRWDPYAGTIDTAALEGCDAVVHLSGERIRAGRWTRAHKRRVLESRVRTTGFLAETLASMAFPPPTLLSASAVGVYGLRGDEELTEQSGDGEGFLADLCAEWEVATAPAEDADIHVVRMRSGLVLSARGGLLPKFLPPGPFVAGRLGSGRQWMSWISIDDEVGAIVHLLEAGIAGPVNLTAPAPVRNADFVKTVSAVTGKRRLPPVPAPALRLLFGREAAGEAALASQRVVPERLLASGYSFIHPELEPALRAVLP